jgi:hypothetical protein
VSSGEDDLVRGDTTSHCRSLDPVQQSEANRLSPLANLGGGPMVVPYKGAGEYTFYSYGMRMKEQQHAHHAIRQRGDATATKARLNGHHWF